MPRYLVERTFSGRCEMRDDAMSAAHRSAGIAWLQSFVSADGARSYCIVESPTPEAIRLAARAGCLPVDRITEVRALRPRGDLP